MACATLFRMCGMSTPTLHYTLVVQRLVWYVRTWPTPLPFLTHFNAMLHTAARRSNTKMWCRQHNPQVALQACSAKLRSTRYHFIHTVHNWVDMSTLRWRTATYARKFTFGIAARADYALQPCSAESVLVAMPCVQFLAYDVFPLSRRAYIRPVIQCMGEVTRGRSQLCTTSL